MQGVVTGDDRVRPDTEKGIAIGDVRYRRAKIKPVLLIEVRHLSPKIVDLSVERQASGHLMITEHIAEQHVYRACHTRLRSKTASRRNAYAYFIAYIFQ